MSAPPVGAPTGGALLWESPAATSTAAGSATVPTASSTCGYRYDWVTTLALPAPARPARRLHLRGVADHSRGRVRGHRRPAARGVDGVTPGSRPWPDALDPPQPPVVGVHPGVVPTLEELRQHRVDAHRHERGSTSPVRRPPRRGSADTARTQRPLPDPGFTAYPGPIHRLRPTSSTARRRHHHHGCSVPRPSDRPTRQAHRPSPVPARRRSWAGWLRERGRTGGARPATAGTRADRPPCRWGDAPPGTRGRPW